MSDLKEDLAELSDVLPKLPAEVTAAVEAAQELDAAAQTLLDAVGHGRQEMQGLLAHVQNALPDFTVQVEMMEKRLETALEVAEKAWNEADDAIEESEKALEAKGEELSTERTELLAVLFEAGTRVDQASADGDAAVDRLEAAAKDGQARVKAAADALTAKAAALGAQIKETTEAIEEAGQVFLDRVTTFVDNGRFDTDVLLDHLEHRMKQYTAHLESVTKEVESRGDAIVLAASKRTTENVRQPLIEEGEKFRTALEAMASNASEHQDTLVKVLAGHEEALEEVKQAAAPVPNGIMEIHEAVVRMRG